jgi:hypothetical protein
MEAQSMKRWIIRLSVIAVLLTLAMAVSYACVIDVGKITGGGFIPALYDNNGKANYGFVAMYEKEKLKGNLEFQDGSLNLHSTKITTLRILSSTSAEFTGIPKLNGIDGYGFYVYTVDNGEPGVEDIFAIAISDPEGNLVYINGDIRDGGNIQMH